MYQADHYPSDDQDFMEGRCVRMSLLPPCRSHGSGEYILEGGAALLVSRNDFPGILGGVMHELQDPK